MSLWGGVTTPVSDFRGERMPRFTTSGGPIDMTLAVRLRRGKRGLVSVRARLLTSDGDQLDPDGFATVWGGMPVAFGVVVPTRGIETRVMLDAFGLLLPAGAYRWDLEIDGKAAKPCPVAVEVVA